MDNAEGSHHFDLYWEADGYTTPILTNVTSPLVYDAMDGESRQYRVRAVNGCDLFTNYASSAAVTDQAGADPTLPSNPLVVVTDLDSCSFTGVQAAWNPWPPGVTTEPGPNSTTCIGPATALPRPSSPTQSHRSLFSPRFQPHHLPGHRHQRLFPHGRLHGRHRGDGQTAPNFAGAMSVTDGNSCAASVVIIAWVDVNGDGPTGWTTADRGPSPGCTVSSGTAWRSPTLRFRTALPPLPTSRRRPTPPTRMSCRRLTWTVVTPPRRGHSGNRQRQRSADSSAGPDPGL